MKIKMTIASCIILLVALFAANTSSSQEPAPNLGETNLIKLTCLIARDAIESAGGYFESCRRASPDVIDEVGNVATTTVTLRFSGLKTKFTFKFRRTMWINTAVEEVE